MKKIVIGTLLATMFTAAQAGVTVSGKVSAWADNTEVGNRTTNSVVTEPTSNFALVARERLGDGLVARATVETSLRGNTFGGDDTRVGDRQATVGLVSKMGSVDLGRNVHSTFLAITNNDPFGTLIGSIAGDVHNLRGLRMTDGVFVTARIAKGWTAAYDHETGTDARSMSLAGRLAGVRLAVAQFESGREKSTVATANYTLGATQVFGSYSEDNTTALSKGRMVGVAHKMGNITAKATYGSTDRNVNAHALGADLALSKRTDLGVVYRNVDRTGTASDVRQVAVGITHRF
jgi:predicted porin